MLCSKWEIGCFRPSITPQKWYNEGSGSLCKNDQFHAPKSSWVVFFLGRWGRFRNEQAQWSGVNCTVRNTILFELGLKTHTFAFTFTCHFVILNNEMRWHQLVFKTFQNCSCPGNYLNCKRYIRLLHLPYAYLKLDDTHTYTHNIYIS